MEELNQISVNLIDRLASEHGLPLHVYFPDRFIRNAGSFRQICDRHYPPAEILFAVKSNPSRGAVRIAARAGIGVDVVSEYELRAALEEGIPPGKIICNGNAKSDEYLDLCLDSGSLLAVDGWSELEHIDSLARLTSKRFRTLLRFSGMPLEGLTSADQSTASYWTKFGFPYPQASEVFKKAGRSQSVEILGVSAHIGTQICNAEGYERLICHLRELIDLAVGHHISVRIIDLGGGYPLSYYSRDRWKEYQSRLRNQLKGAAPSKDFVTWDNLPLGYGHVEPRELNESTPWFGKAYWTEFSGRRMLEHILTHEVEPDLSLAGYLRSIGEPVLIVEPGRGLVGSAGVTVARASGVKTVMGNHVVSLDMGINNHGTNLITPDIFPVEVLPHETDDRPVDAFLAGRLCFSGDMISKVKVSLNRLPGRGEYVVIHHTGAYCADHFASNSCGFPRPAKIAIDGKERVEVWRKAERFEDVFAELI